MRRKIPLVTGEFYHVFNRGVAKMQIYNSSYDYTRFLKTMVYYSIKGPKPRFSIFSPTTNMIDRSKKIVEVICYCLMPNHFHLLLKQLEDDGITEFMSKLSNSYTKYINIKNNRVGPLLQGDFKSVHIGDDGQLLHVNRYIHLNPLVGYVTEDLDNYKWSSYPGYISLVKEEICLKDIIMSNFKSKENYKAFVLDHVDYAQKLESIKHLLFDSEE